MSGRRSTERFLVEGREVAISHPDKVLFPAGGYTKLDLVRYYLSVAEGVLRAVGGRPMALKRYPNGIDEPFFFQKRAPVPRPDWIETVEITFPSGRKADEIVIRDAAQLAWVVNLGCIDLHPHPVRSDDLEHPDELRIDLDPVPGIPWSQLREVARIARAVLEDHGLHGWPKTSGSRGLHIYVRIRRGYTFSQLRHAALAVAREVERRAPSLATSRWWKEERHGVFLDYNQNAKDRTIASAWSVRPVADARVSMPLRWDELGHVEPSEFTLATAPARFARHGDAWTGIDRATGSLDSLLELSERQLGELGEAPYPPHFARESGEPPRVQPSRRARTAVAPKPKKPLLVVARAQREADALAGLERWLRRHPEILPHLRHRDILVDSMRGRSTTWTRVRVNLEQVPPDKRPHSELPDPDFDPATAR